MKDDLQISERELLAMTKTLEAMHSDLFPRVQHLLVGACDVTAGQTARVAAVSRIEHSRRNFLRGGLVTAGTIGGGLALAGCGGSTTSNAPSPAIANGNDLKMARLVASLEVLAVNTYSSALNAAGAGKPLEGLIPAALTQFASTARRQHQDHCDAWNAMLQAAGQVTQRDPDPKLNGSVQTALGQVRAAGDVAKLVLTLENVALQTYTNAASVLSSTIAREQALTIAPVEAQHAAILNFMLGQYPAADTFVPVSLARNPSD